MRFAYKFVIVNDNNWTQHGTIEADENVSWKDLAVRITQHHCDMFCPVLGIKVEDATISVVVLNNTIVDVSIKDDEEYDIKVTIRPT